MSSKVFSEDAGRVLANKIKRNTAAIEALNGTDEGSVDKKVSDKIAEMLPLNSFNYELVTAEDVNMWFLAPGTYSANGALLKTWNQLLEDGDITVGSGNVAMDYDGTISYPSRKIVSSPIHIESYDGEARFEGVNKIVFPDDITAIGEWAFTGSHDLMEVVFPLNLEYIGFNSFASLGYAQELDDIKPIIIPDSTKDVGEQAFNYSKIRKIVLSKNMDLVRSICYYCQYLQDATIPEGIKTLSGTFTYCNSLTKVILPQTITMLDKGVFSSCYNLTSITIPNNVECIGDSAFSFSGIEEVIIPSGVKIIKDNAFDSCDKLKSVIMCEGVERIERSVFDYCYDLTEITIPNSVSYIDSRAFYRCLNLTTIHYSGTATGAPWGATNATVVP